MGTFSIDRRSFSTGNSSVTGMFGINRLGMANHYHRLSSSFACNPVELDGKRKKDTVLVHIVGGVHLEGVRIVFLLKYKRKMKKDEPKQTKKGIRLSSSFRVRLSSFLLILK